jgi:uncharacterized membrane protein (DUF485 family)
MTHEAHAWRRLGRLRWRMAIVLSTLMIVIYFGFILLIAFKKQVMGLLLVQGLSIGILLGFLVIALTWATTWFYVRWASRYIDDEIARQRQIAS